MDICERQFPINHISSKIFPATGQVAHLSQSQYSVPDINFRDLALHWATALGVAVHEHHVISNFFVISLVTIIKIVSRKQNNV